MRSIVSRSVPLLRPTMYRGMRVASSSAPDAKTLAATLNSNPALVESVIQAMTPATRRNVAVASGAYELFGKDVVSEEIKKPEAFEQWAKDALKRKVDAATANEKVEPVPFRDLLVIALHNGIPFVGFGCLDNTVMIVAGDTIDRTLGFYLGCSVMASAAMGNICSGITGMQVHGFIERIINMVGLTGPDLTEKQRHSRRVFMAEHIGRTIGVAAGLGIGMTPLLFIGDEEGKEKEKRERREEEKAKA